LAVRRSTGQQDTKSLVTDVAGGVEVTVVNDTAATVRIAVERAGARQRCSWLETEDGKLAGSAHFRIFWADWRDG
jgi:hypothetical protein